MVSIRSVWKEPEGIEDIVAIKVIYYIMDGEDYSTLNIWAGAERIESIPCVGRECLEYREQWRRIAIEIGVAFKYYAVEYWRGAKEIKYHPA